MRNKKVMSLVVATLAFLIVSGSVAAADNLMRGRGGEKPNLDPEKMAEREAQHEAIKTAIENNDYTTWAELVGDKDPSNVITEENFSQLVKIHQLMEAGDKEGAKALAKELGLKRPGFGRRGHRRPMQDTNGDGVCDYRDKK